MKLNFKLCEWVQNGSISLSPYTAALCKMEHVDEGIPLVYLQSLASEYNHHLLRRRFRAFSLSFCSRFYLARWNAVAPGKQLPTA